MDNVVILNPRKDIHATHFEDNNVVHQLELNQVWAILTKLKHEGKDYSPSLESSISRVHNTITLSGSRGSGKTSFLHTIIRKIETYPNNDIEVLNIVDPTLVEEKGHIFLNIVSRIKERIDSMASNDPAIMTTCDYLEWDKNLNSLAAGLPMLDGISGGLDPSDWNDTTFVMRDGLRRVTGANNLERYFHIYVHQSLRLLKKKFLLIAFDDVDTDFSKGWPVLETLRKYLTSPQIITFLSGDLDLYSFVVRKKQWKNFGKTLLKNEYDKADKGGIIYANGYPELVEKLESQYMMKLLKPEYRITLSTLGSKLATNKITVFVDSNDNEDNILYRKYESYLKTNWNVAGNNIKSVYIKFFSALPLRTQLSLLNIFAESDDADSKLSQLHQITKGLSDIFYSELHTANVDIWELINEYGLTNIYLLKFLLDNDIIDEASQFFPKLNKPSLDGAVVALGAVLTERITTNPYEIFDHIIRLSNIVSKATVWPVHGNGQNPNISDYVSHSRSLFDYGLQKTASLQSAYITSFNDITLKNEGLIPLRALQKRAKDARSEDDLSLDEVFESDGITSLTSCLGFIPSLGVQNNLGQNKILYSFFNILASIGDIIQHTTKEEMRNEFVRMAQLREYPMFYNTNSFVGNNSQHQEVEDIRTEEIADTSIDNFISTFYDWRMSWDDVMGRSTIPPYLLGRIMVRTIYSFSQISTNQTLSVGDLMHRYLIVFMNAILVEEVMENYGNNKLILTNPSNSDENFRRNYKNNLESSHLLFDFVLKCPLILAYINPVLLKELDLETPDYNIFICTSKLNILGRSRYKTPQINDTVKSNNTRHIDILIEYFQNENTPKEQLNFDTTKKAIKRIFANKIVYNEVVNNVLANLQNSDKW